LRPGGGPRAARQYGAAGRGDRAARAGDRRRDLYLHQSQHHRTRARLVTHGEGARGANRVPVVRALHRMEMNMDRTEEARSTDALTEVPEQPAATEGADERNDQAPSGEESAPHGRIDDLTPRQVVAELDKYIVGQDAAKK